MSNSDWAPATASICFMILIGWLIWLDRTHPHPSPCVEVKVIEITNEQ